MTRINDILRGFCSGTIGSISGQRNKARKKLSWGACSLHRRPFVQSSTTQERHLLICLASAAILFVLVPEKIKGSAVLYFVNIVLYCTRYRWADETTEAHAAKVAPTWQVSSLTERGSYHSIKASLNGLAWQLSSLNGAKAKSVCHAPSIAALRQT
ncbi:hypothetical protein BJV74DRAFT_469393 [Russula compacta]|nr:hypothetical protein BJV74DRAFT_469393 [Russula compacta]